MMAVARSDVVIMMDKESNKNDTADDTASYLESTGYSVVFGNKSTCPNARRLATQPYNPASVVKSSEVAQVR